MCRIFCPSLLCAIHAIVPISNFILSIKSHYKSFFSAFAPELFFAMDIFIFFGQYLFLIYLQSLFPGINYLQFSHPELSLAIKSVLESENYTVLPEQVRAFECWRDLSDSQSERNDMGVRRSIWCAVRSERDFVHSDAYSGGEELNIHTHTQLNKSKTI